MKPLIFSLLVLALALPAMAAEPSFDYDPIGQRDPFRGLRSAPPASTERGPLAAWSLSDLTLVAVVKDGDRSTALVQSPDGVGLLAALGTVLGSERAVVIGLTADRLLLREDRYLPGNSGVALRVDHELKLGSQPVAALDQDYGP